MADWIKDWAIVISAGVTFLLAIAAFWSIWRVRNNINRDKKERFLKEIIDWTSQILIVGASAIRSPSPELFGVTPDQPVSRDFLSDRMDSTIYWIVKADLNLLIKGYTYISKITRKINDPKLNCSVITVGRVLLQHRKLANLRLDGKLKHPEAVGRHREILDSCAVELIEHAVNIFDI